VWVNPRYAPAADPPPETLLTFRRANQEARLERRSYRGTPYLAWVLYGFGPDGPRELKMMSIRFGEAGRLAEAIRAATAPGRPALAAPARPAPPGPRALPLPLDKGGRFDEFG
jgi:hypothetical protein